MPNRYRYTDRAQWRYLGPAFQGIDEDLAALESATPKNRNQVGTASPSSDVRPFLPVPARKPTIRVHGLIDVTNSTQWPSEITGRKQDRLKSVRVQNISATDILSVGHGTYDNQNHTTEPYTVPAGQELVLAARPQPVFARYKDSSIGQVRVIHTFGA